MLIVGSEIGKNNNIGHKLIAFILFSAASRAVQCYYLEYCT